MRAANVVDVKKETLNSRGLQISRGRDLTALVVVALEKFPILEDMVHKKLVDI